MVEMHQANRQHWDAVSGSWKELRECDGLWRQCATRPEIAFTGGALGLIGTFCGALKGRDVCVIGSGDNYAAFALAGLGARVTSTDISDRQLDIARERARELDLDISFVRADAADLEPLHDSAFDLVCSTNGFFVWISDLESVASAVGRVLRPGGFYVFYDIPYEPGTDSALVDWRRNPRAGLPVWLSMCVQKLQVQSSGRGI